MKILVIGPESPKIVKKEAKEKITKKKEVSKETTTTVAKKTAQEAGSGAFRVIISFILALGAYFTAHHFLPETLAPWQLELASFIFALLVLKAISMAYGSSDKRISGGVFWLIFAICAWQLVSAYSDYEPKVKEPAQSHFTEVLTLYPRSEPYIFYLKEVGDRTPLFKAPAIKYTALYSSHDFGYRIFFNDGTSYPGGPEIKIPDKRHAVVYIKATKPNQYINITITQR